MCVYRSKQLFLFLCLNPALLPLLGNEKDISVQNFLTSYSQDNPWSGLGSLRLDFFPGDREYPFERTAIDWLFPFYDSLEFLFFSQLGFRHNLDRRDIINLGGGGRFFRKNWMLGANAFCDCDLTGTNTRLGLGLESWTNFLQFSMNGYLGLSSPRHSSLQPNYQESPAHGLDFRLHYWLPFFPRLGGKIFYEQYFGKQVSLFGRSDLQHDPFVITTGVEFTPFPLLSMEIDHRMSKASRHYTLFNIRLNYRFGESLSSQLNPFSVAKMRFLNENRYNFVSRNHVIVFNYSEYTYDIFVSPASISAIEFASSTVSLKCPNTKTLAHFEWEAQNFIEAGGEITLVSAGKSNAEYTVKLPPHKLRLSSQRRTVPTNEYTLQVFAVDTSGQRSKTGTLSITVSQDPQVSIDRKYFLNGTPVTDFTTPPVANDQDFVEIEQVRLSPASSPAGRTNLVLALAAGS